MARQDPILFRVRVAIAAVAFWGRVKGAGRSSQRHAWVAELNKLMEPTGRYVTVCGVIPDTCQPIDQKYRSQKRMVRVCSKCDVLVVESQPAAPVDERVAVTQ